MKKSKIVVGTLFVATLVAGGIAVSGCDGCNKKPDDGPKEDVISFSSINLDTAEVKMLYDMDEEFVYDGLKVSTVDKNETQDVLLDPVEISVSEAVAEGSLVIDSSKFQKGVAGEYAINVSYTKEEVTKTSSFTVTVKKAAGLIVEKTTTDYTLTSEGTVIATDDLTVHFAGANGKRGNSLASTKYTLSCFMGSEEVAATENQYKVTQPGVYQLWAEVSDYTIPGTKEKVDVKDFVLIYMLDEIESIAVKTDEGKFTQTENRKDKMSSTWKFVVTYKSGLTKEVTSKTEGLEITGIDPTKATDAGSATVTYKELNAKGEEMTATVNVPYTVTTPPPGVQIEEYALDLTAFDGRTDKDVLTQADMTGDNDFIKLNDVENTKPNVRVNAEGVATSIEIKGEGMLVTFMGTGTLAVKFCSTGSSNESDFAVKSGENYLLASNDAALAANKESEFVYKVKGTDANAVTVEYQITAPGDYYLCTRVTPSGAGDGKGKYERAGRIIEVVMVDNIETGGGSGGSGTTQEPASFLVPDEAITGDAATIAAEGTITDNDLFTVTTQGGMKYSVGSTDTDANGNVKGVPNPTKPVTVTLQDGTSKTFLQGLVDLDDTALTATTKNLVVTAKAAVTVRLYVSFVNSSFNSDRPAAVKFYINGTEQTDKALAVNKRQEITPVEIDLAAGEVLTVNATNNHKDKTGRLWLFGVEGKAV